LAHKPDPAGLKLRLVAAQKLKSVLAGEHFAPLTVADLNDGRDRALANRLITTALRRQGQINLMLNELLEKGMPPRSGTFEAVLRLALAQLVYLPDLGAHSALFLAVEALKRDNKARHLTGLMNAVLRKAQANSARYALDGDALDLIPETLLTRWAAAYGEDAMPAFAEALIAGAPLDLTLRDESDELVSALNADRLMADSVRIESRDRPVEALVGYDEGKWWVQDAASSLPARLFKLAEGSSVLDLCAAPGGKTAQLSKAGYKVTALDSDGKRLERLKANMARLGYAPEVVEGDASTYAPAEQVDGVLLDAPCSATGTFRRHPEVLWSRSLADIAGRKRLQQAMLKNAVNALKPNGTLIYCVCSLEPEEGEEQVEWISTNLKALTLDPITDEEVPGLEAAVSADGVLRTHPAMSPNKLAGGMDGFFVARFRRTG
jgi:16S rRNA (cytosine967-C5)-methyltransferase